MSNAIEFFLYDTVKLFFLLSVVVFVTSYVQSYFPPERSRKILGRFKGVGGNIIGALLGTVTPFCSCSSIPIFIGFTGAGLPLGVTFSFLISSPMVDLGSLVLLMSIFGAKVAVIYVVFGLLIAVLGGTLIEKLHMEKYVRSFIKNTGKITEEWNKMTIKERWLYGKEQVIETIKKVAPYIFIGVGIGAIIHNFIPQTWVETILGKEKWYSILLAVIVGIPMYADVFGTVPVAETLLSKGAGLGTILSFLMSVTTLSLPSLIMLKKVIKPKLLVTFVVIVTIGIVLVGYLFNGISFLII